MDHQATLIPHSRAETGAKTRVRQPLKIARILAVLYQGESLHRFEAIRLGDTALNSTISALANEHHLDFDRVTIALPSRFGRPAKVTNYRLAATSRARAAALLKHWGIEV